jgi:hypothetical protein
MRYFRNWSIEWIPNVPSTFGFDALAKEPIRHSFACSIKKRSTLMSKPLVVSIPHNLGQAEAMRRLQGGMAGVKSQFGDKVASIQETWSGNRMDFRVGAMGQNVSGHLEVMQDQVRVEVQLPWILAMVAEKAKTFIQKQGTLLLEKK